jgi:hypothetical protein
MKGHEVFLACNKNLAGLIREKEKLSGIFLLPDDIRGVAMQVQALRTIRGAIRDNHIDTLILGTTEIKPVRYLLPFLPRVNIIGIVHNSAKLNSSAAFKYFYPIRIRKYFVLGDYIRRNITGLSEERVFAYYPVYFPKPVDRVALTKPSHEKWIIIPGAVRSERKDYILLLRKIHEHGLPENIRLVLLGKSYEGEREIDALIRGVNAREERIVTFDEYLDFDTFHEYLSKADFVLPLLKITADLFYDDKRISGAFNLAYGYRLPSTTERSTNSTKYFVPPAETICMLALSLKPTRGLKGSTLMIWPIDWFHSFREPPFRTAAEPYPHFGFSRLSELRHHVRGRVRSWRRGWISPAGSPGTSGRKGAEGWSPGSKYLSVSHRSAHAEWGNGDGDSPRRE